jgi:hypothetical protein
MNGLDSLPLQSNLRKMGQPRQLLILVTHFPFRYSAVNKVVGAKMINEKAKP